MNESANVCYKNKDEPVNLSHGYDILLERKKICLYAQKLVFKTRYVFVTLLGI